MRRDHLNLIVGFVLAAIFGYWLAGTAAPKKAVRQNLSAGNEKPEWKTIKDEPAVKFRGEEREDRPKSRRDDDAIKEGALEGQRSLVFADREAMEAFLKKSANKVKLLGRIDALHALRVGFSNLDDFESLLSGKEELSLIFPVAIPDPGDGTAQPGAVALGDGLLDWLGITEDHTAWGKGVKIAILDTGVAAHAAFGTSISGVNLVSPPSDIAQQNGHGTAVASMIIGRGNQTPGVAPSAEIFSYRIADDAGRSDSFLLAEGIIAAIDGGAQLINISLGSQGDSALVRNAIAYARKAGAVIVAATGNNGLNRISYPAANEGVIAVGAVDAEGNHLDFSNTGQQISVSAPGFGINAAFPGNKAASVSGTSFSSPIFTGVVAAIMTQAGPSRLSPDQAVNLAYAYLNDGGAAGKDVSLGRGTPDIGRVLNRNRRGIYDAAIASQRVLPPSSNSPYGQIEVLVQNRGTEPLINTNVQVSTPTGVINSNITQLPPNQVQTVRVPISRAPQGNITLRFESSVSLSGGFIDTKKSNNRQAQVYAPITR
ncbi:MAG: S8 family serine peptidase [Akkermansiaceae bacterium]|nr:S8 family serine peptidase [Akkermansiaceae bacterium]